MKVLYLHIGTPKTGTSTLQHFLYDNKEILESNGIYYPIWNKLKAWGGEESTDGNFGWIQRCQLTSEQKIDEVAKCFEQHEKVLLSTENIWLEVLDKKSFLNDLKSIDEELQVKVIVYLRKQVDYLESQYREYVRLILFQEPIDAVIDFNNPALENVKNSLDYLSVLDNMAEAIGKENVLVRVYEKSSFLNESIIDDFLDLLGLKLTDQYALPKKNYNPSMSNVALELKRRMNASSYATQAEMNECYYEVLMKDGIDKVASGGIVNFQTLLDSEQRQKFMERFEDGNREIAYKYLHREDGMLFHQKDVPGTCASHVSTQDLLDQTITVFTSVDLLRNQRLHSLENGMTYLSVQIDEGKSVSKRMEQELDQFKTKYQELEQQLDLFKSNIEEIRCLMVEEKEQHEAERQKFEDVINGKQEEIEHLKNTLSWRLTAPLRMIRRLIFKEK